MRAVLAVCVLSALQAALGTAFRQAVALGAKPIKNVATSAEAWATKGPSLEADIAALTKATEGGMVVGDLKHIAFRAAEFYGYFCIGECIGRRPPQLSEVHDLANDPGASIGDDDNDIEFEQTSIEWLQETDPAATKRRKVGF